MLKDTPAQIAPSTYYAAKVRRPCARAVRDVVLTERIAGVHTSNYGVYGVRKIHADLNRTGTPVARCTVERLMRAAGIRGITRDRSPRTTRPAPETGRPADLVDRQFTADRPNQLCVGRYHLHSDVLRVGVCRVRHRCVLPHGGGLAGVHHDAHGAGAGRPKDGRVAP